MKKNLLIVLFVLSFLLISGTNLQASQTDYSVKAGDSLWKISQSTGVSVDQLMQLNGLQSDKLQVGQVLHLKIEQIAAATDPDTSASEAVYIILPGDSLWSIADKFGTSVTSLMQVNGLKSDFLAAGDALIVSENPIQVSRSADRQIGLRMIEYARQYLGTPYAYGGMSPRGFDCSGFVTYVLSAFQISVPRTAAQQYSVGTAVDRGSLLPGDLVFFRCSGSVIDHVGIYVGEEKFIHSSSPRSGGVILTSLSESYYVRSYVGARRVIQ